MASIIPASSRRCFASARSLNHCPSILSHSSPRQSLNPQQCPFSSTASQRSNIGRMPLSVPKIVDVSIIKPPEEDPNERVIGRVKQSPVVVVKGPLGEIKMAIPDFIQLDHDQITGRMTVSVLNATEPQQKAMWGTVRACLNNHILGVSEGHTCLLRMVGVGYRATVEKAATTVQPEYPGQHFVSLKAGYSHPIEIGIPVGVKASTPQPTRILLECHDKETLKSFAAQIRKWRKPEPYKGKGIFVDDETIKLKAKKIK